MLACLWLLVGCGKPKQELLVGTWRDADPEIEDLTLSPDGTCIMGFYVKMAKQPGEPLIQGFSEAPGTWKIDGKTLILTADVDKTSPRRLDIISLNETHLKYRSLGQLHERTKAATPSTDSRRR
jgi:hypothetical protein